MLKSSSVETSTLLADRFTPCGIQQQGRHRTDGTVVHCERSLWLLSRSPYLAPEDHEH